LPTEADETLREYLHRFSRQCNELHDIVDADIIGMFLSRTTCETLVHKLGCKRLRTTRELLDIATSHASSKQAVRAIFDRSRDKAKRDEDASEGAFNLSRRRRTSNGLGTHSWPPLSARARRRPLRVPWITLRGCSRDLPKPLLPHQACQKDCGFMKKFLFGGSKMGEGKRSPPSRDDIKKKEDTFL
jgi:hypothetical protein